MSFPKFEKAAKNADLRLLCIRQGLEDGVKLGDGGEGVGEGLVAEVEEGVHEHLYLGGIVDAVRHVLLAHRRIQFLKENNPDSFQHLGHLGVF